jgi:HlyD family secretion protein
MDGPAKNSAVKESPKDLDKTDKDNANSRPEQPAGDSAAGPKPPEAPKSKLTANASPQPAPSRVTIGYMAPRMIALAVVIGLVVTAAWLWSETPTEESRLVLQGNIDVRQVNLSFKVDGRLVKLFVDEGDHVKKGQLLAVLDKRYFEDDLRVAKAHRDNAAATLDRLENGSRPQEKEQAKAITAEREAALLLAEITYKRTASLVPDKAAAQEDADRARGDRDQAVARLNQARESQRLIDLGPRAEDIAAAKADLAMQEGNVVESQRRLEDSELRAPNDGIILTRAQEEGAILSAGVPVLTLTLASPVWVRTYVNERDLGLVRENMPAEVYTDSDPHRPYSANVGFISPTAEFTPKTVETRQLRTDLVYNLRVLVDNPDGGLRQGMPVSVALKLSQPRPLTLGERFQLFLVRLHLADGETPR